MAENGDYISSETSEGEGGLHKSPATKDSKHIYIKFVDQEGKTVHQKVQRTGTFQEIFKVYRKNQGLDRDPNFIYNGSRLSGHLTPAELNFQNGEQIDVYVLTSGGYDFFPSQPKPMCDWAL